MIFVNKIKATVMVIECVLLANLSEEKN